MWIRGVFSHILPLVIALLIGSIPVCTVAQSPSRPARSHASLKSAIDRLIDEARQARQEQRIHIESPEFAKRFEGDISPEDVLDALARPAHADPFIDAYIRWQLTSFDPPLPDLDDAQFNRLMGNMPAMIENPRAAKDIVDSFRQADAAGRLADRTFAKLKEAAAELDRRTPIAEDLNRPALGYRDWLAAKLESSRGRSLQLLIERCAATINAGWPSRNVKTDMTAAFKDAAGDASLTPAQRHALAAQLRMLIGLRRESVKEATFLASGAVNISFTTAGVDKDDAERWIALLTNHGP